MIGMIEPLQAIVRSYHITAFAPANGRFKPERRNADRFVGLTEGGGFTAFTFSRAEARSSGLPITN